MRSGRRDERPRHRVEASGVPRMAAADAAHREPAAAQHAEAPDRLERVLRARRMEAACGADERAHRPLVQPDHDLGEDAHWSINLFHRSSRLAASSAFPAPRTRARALTTTSTAGSPRWRSRKLSRISRRIRFRSTELPATFVATASPRRGPSAAFARATMPKKASPKRRPSAYAASNSILRRSRRCGENPSCLQPTPREDTRPPGGRARLRNEPLAALRSAASENLAAVGRGHARAKSVRALAAHLARLIRSFHGLEAGTGRCRVPDE